MPVTCGFCSGCFVFFEEQNFNVTDVVPLKRVLDVPFLQLYASRSGCETPQVTRNLRTLASPLAYTKLNCGYKTYCNFHLSPGRKDSHGHFFPECLVAAAIREHDINCPHTKSPGTRWQRWLFHASWQRTLPMACPNWDRLRNFADYDPVTRYYQLLEVPPPNFATKNRTLSPPRTHSPPANL